MITFNKPSNLNGAELLTELNKAGINITQPPEIDGEGNLWLNIKETDEAKAAPIVAAHNGTIVAPDKTAEKAAVIAKLGITADEAALLLA